MEKNSFLISSAGWATEMVFQTRIHLVLLRNKLKRLWIWLKISQENYLQREQPCARPPSGRTRPLGDGRCFTTGKPTHLQTRGAQRKQEVPNVGCNSPGLRVDRNPDRSGTVSHLTLLVGTLRNKQGFWIVFFHSNQWVTSFNDSKKIHCLLVSCYQQLHYFNGSENSWVSN